MTKKVYHLSTCKTCERIIQEVGIGEEFLYQDVKKEKITSEQLEEMVKITSSYEALFNRQSRKYKELGLKDKNLTEEDYKNYILQEYTMLKRPVFIIGEAVFIGNSKKNVEAIKLALSEQ